MLQLVLGIAGTGKSTWMMEQIQARAKQKKQSILLVPEQFSSSAETLVLEKLGDAGSAYVDVLSFRTLANRLLQGVEENVHILSEAGRAVYVKQALKAVQKKLKRLGHTRQDTAFCNLCAQTLVELKTAGATSESLQQIGLKTADAKFLDLALILGAYESMLAGGAMDEEDRLHLACEKARADWFCGKVCYIDNFDGFTAPEYEMLCLLMRHSEAVCVALCCDGLQETEGGLGLFSPPRKTAQRLLRNAQNLGRSVMAPLQMTTPKRAAKGDLLCVNELLAGGRTRAFSPQGQLTISQAADRHEEVKTACAAMRRLAQEGVSYSKMALLCRDVGLYESIVRREMTLFDIPWHSDTPDTIEYTAPVSFVRAALKLLQRGLVSDAILELLKTDLCGFSQQALFSLENYVYTWQPKAATWRVPFTQNPKGLLRKMDEAAQDSLQLAESVRSAAWPLLKAFVQAAKGKSAKALSTELYRLMEHFEAPLHHAKKAELMNQKGDYALAERSRRAWDLCMDFLDQMALLLQEECVSAAEYEELFLLLVRSTDFGQVPKTLESVPFASADRARLAEPEHCFVLGLQEGEFPAKVGYSGLLTHSDRDLLVENNIEMPGSFQNRILLEQMFLYRTLTSARQSLHLSYPAYHEGVGGLPCEALCLLQEKLNPPALCVDEWALVPTKEAAFERLCTLYHENTQEGVNLNAALFAEADPFTHEHRPLLKEIHVPNHFFLKDKEALRQLTGEVPRLSPTRAEHYFKCRFAYLMEYVLHIHPRRRAEFSVQESGSLVHYVLEQVFREQGKDFAGVDDESLRRQTEVHIEEFAKANFPEMNLRLHAILSRIGETVFSLLQYLRNWAKNSEFKTEALELGIGGQEVQALSLQSENGAKLQVVGKVDRVDLLKKDGKTYLCILDYKTGGKQFSLHEVLYGLNMQMLVYMNALCKQKNGRFQNAIPAGMLYLSADPSPSAGSRHDAGQSAFRLDGLLLEDAAVLEALDCDKSGLFLPVRYKKDGAPSLSKHLASLQYLGGLFLHVEKVLEEMAEGLQGGDFSARPLVKSDQSSFCDFCPYPAACRHETGRNEVPIVQDTQRLKEIEQAGAKEVAFDE